MIELNGTFFAQIINFLILVVLLRAFAYKPVVNMLKARQDKIQESLDKADADAAEADMLPPTVAMPSTVAMRSMTASAISTASSMVTLSKPTPNTFTRMVSPRNIITQLYSIAQAFSFVQP